MKTNVLTSASVTVLSPNILIKLSSPTNFQLLEVKLSMFTLCRLRFTLKKSGYTTKPSRTAMAGMMNTMWIRSSNQEKSRCDVVFSILAGSKK